MTVTAVVCSFWEPRFANVERIVNDLQHGTAVPDRILILNNNPTAPHRFDHFRGPQVSVIGGDNMECRGKFVAALFHPAHHYLLADDDTSVGPRTLECLLRHAKPGFVTGYWGVRLTDRSFMNGQLIFPSVVPAPTKVDAFHGRVIFMAHDALVRMLAAEETVRLADPEAAYVGDDILAGLANPGSMIIPMRGDETFVDLDQHGVAMQTRPGYFADRDRFTAAAVTALAS
ncbi:MAG TPA: hypothetical protein VHT75_04315 [Acidimicrobiales bacterium]|jgi:hypothetical protein|nr:hypothetical protein [Acidimicrobiales bacterium]